MFDITMDGRTIAVEEGATLLDAARSAGIHIPTLCYLKNVSNIGSCRLCVVEVEGVSGLVSSCNTLAHPGMVVKTRSEAIDRARRTALQLIIAEHGLNSTQYCFSCTKNGSCELQDRCRELGVETSPFKITPASGEILDSNPFLTFNPSLCIRCQRCVGACNNAAGNHTLVSGKAGLRTTILAPFGRDWKSTNCESCGSCAAACPTGAITMKRRRAYRSWEIKKVRTTCPHCATGCQYDLIVKDGRIVDTEAADGPTNHGLLCVKGRSASFDFVQSDRRLKTPLIRSSVTGELEPASWDEALDLVARKFTELRDKFGGESLAAFACARSANEDIYMLQKMARTVFKTNNVDNCARVCHGPSVAGLQRTLGSGAMTNPISDICENAEVVVLVGSNPEEAHPVIGMQLRAAIRRG